LSFFEELKRRNVFRVGVAYGVAGWVILQVADLVLEAIEAPAWVLKALLLVIAIGFVAALIIAWAYEMTPEGIKKESDVDRSQSVVADTGRKMDRIIIGFLVIAVGVLLYRQIGLAPENEPESLAQSKPEQTESDAGELTEPPSAKETSDKSIAVLPFTTRSTSEDDKFFSDGMHDDLLTQLAKIGSLKVISRTSMMEYRDTTKNLRQIGQELGVANILEGAVQRVGKQVRINVQLIDTETDEHLWAETYDREMSLDNLLSIQSEMSRSIAQAMQTTLSPQEEALLNRKLTNNLEALESYRRAKGFSDYFDENDLARAELEVDHALGLDPDFVAAWALKAYIHLSQYWGVNDKPEYRQAARDAIDRGRGIEQDSPDLDLAEGYYQYWGFLDYEAALEVLEPILLVYPNDVELLKVLSFVNRRYGRFDIAYSYMEKALSLDPRDIRLVYTMGETKKSMREWEEAERFLGMMQTLDPTNGRTQQLRAEIIAARDLNFAEAARSLALARLDLSGFFGVDIWTLRIQERNFEAALEVADFGADKESSEGFFPPEMARGITHLLAGDADKAMPLLEQARDLLQQWVSEDYWYYQISLCQTLGALADRSATEVECKTAIENMPKDAYDQSDNLEWVASAFAMAGLEDKAMDLLEEVAEARVANPVSLIAANPMFDNLRQNQRWQTLMRKHGIEQ
jgi:TolB-like protein/Tfp pilus assembly protein PilF